MPISEFLNSFRDLPLPLGLCGEASEKNVLHHCTRMRLRLHSPEEGSEIEKSGARWYVEFEDVILAFAGGLLDINVSGSETHESTAATKPTHSEFLISHYLRHRS